MSLLHKKPLSIQGSNPCAATVTEGHSGVRQSLELIEQKGLTETNNLLSTAPPPLPRCKTVINFTQSQSI
jgi:hypothetical protein